MSTRVQTIYITLEVEGTLEDVCRVVDEELDAGVLQDAISDHLLTDLPGTRSVRVLSADWDTEKP